MDLSGRDMLTLEDYTAEEILFLLKEAEEWKKKYLAGSLPKPLEGKNLSMIFEKRSTRTRISCEVAMFYLGGHALFLGKDDIQLGAGESIQDTARVISRMSNGILARVNNHQTVVALSENSSRPVINALSDKYHPLQILADMLTIKEYKSKFEGLKIAWIGDGNNVAHSLFLTSGKLGIDMTVATPVGYEMDKKIVERSLKSAKESGATLELLNDPKQAVQDADVIVTDTFVSMGEEGQKETKVKAFTGFSVNQQLVDSAKKDYIFMHCLPRKEFEVTDDIFFSKNSVVYDEAENRLHTTIAVFANLMA